MTRALGWIDPGTLGRAPHTGWRALDAPRVVGELRLGTVPERVLSQGSVGCCTATSTGIAVEALAPLAGYAPELPDIVSLYARGRAALGRAHDDTGAMLGDVVAALRRGWEPARADLPAWGPAWTAPPPVLPDDAPRLINTEALDFDVATIAWELALGFPVVVGLRITAAWDDGPATLPEPAGESVGGHAVTLVGFSSERRAWRVRNSWGPEWGDRGEAWLPWSWTVPPWCGEVWALRAVRRFP